MMKAAAGLVRERGMAPRHPYDAAAMWRLAGQGAATYLSYWTLFFALQRAFNGRC